MNETTKADTHDAVLPDDVREGLRKPVARVRSHGGDVSVAYDASARRLTVSLTGVCTACPALPVTFGAAFWEPLRHLPSVDDVVLKNLRINERTLHRIASSFESAC